MKLTFNLFEEIPKDDYFNESTLFCRHWPSQPQDVRELGVISYDEDGRKLNGQDTHIQDPIPAPRYAKLAGDGYHVVQSIAVPITATSIRLAVRDLRGNRIGSLEVQLPVAKTAEPIPPQIK